MSAQLKPESMRLFRVRKTVVKMLKSRGYTSVAAEGSEPGGKRGRVDADAALSRC